MDAHARRVVAPVLNCLAQYQDGAASLTELPAMASAAALELDNANADLRVGLEQLDPDLERVAFTVPAADQTLAVGEAFEHVLHLASGE